MRFHLAVRLVVGVGLVWALATLAGWQVAAAGEDSSKVSPEADKLLKKAGAFYAGLKNFSVEVSARVVEQQGAKEKVETFSGTAAMQRPNLFALRVKFNDGGRLENACDGKSVAGVEGNGPASDPQPAPKDLDGMKFQWGDAGMWALAVGVLAHVDPYKAMTEKAKSIILIAQEEVGGVKCDHLKAVTAGNYDWEMWVEPSEKPLVRKMVYDLTRLAGKGGSRADDKVLVTVTYGKWATDAELPPETFKLPEANKAR